LPTGLAVEYSIAGVVIERGGRQKAAALKDPDLVLHLQLLQRN
jgi:hypothetical protein